MMQPNELMSRGIIDLQKEQPFFALLSMRLKVSEFPENMQVRHRTLAVDMQGNLYYDGEFVSGLSRDEIKGVFCHEVLHVALQHFARQGDRNRTVCNIAQDMVVNMLVTNAGLKLAECGIPYDKYSDSCRATIQGVKLVVNHVSEKSWEQIYDELQFQFAQQGVTPPPDYCGFDVHLAGEKEQADANSVESKAEIAQRWASALAEASMYAQKIGKLPKGMERFVSDTLKAKVTWKQELLSYVRPMLSPVDFSYRKPSRKSLVLGVYLPVVEKEHLQIEVLVDTSGSMGEDDLKQFLGEVTAIAEAHQHVKMFVTFCDTVVHGRYEVSNGDIPKIFSEKMRGGGGTELENGLKDIDNKGEEPEVVIILTDGHNDFKYKNNPFPFEIIWVVSQGGNTKIPYGKVISMGNR